MRTRDTLSLLDKMISNLEKIMLWLKNSMLGEVHCLVPSYRFAMAGPYGFRCVNRSGA
jgi:hypothetical protein